MPEINLLAVFLASVASFVIGGIWYGPLFGNAWMAANGFTTEQIRNGPSPLISYGTSFVIALVTAYTFSMFLGPDLGWSLGATFGLIAGLVWVGGSLATNHLFEAQSPLLLMINGGYHAIRFAAMGAILGGM